MTTLEKAIIGGTHLCGHGHMAVMCRLCPIEKERDEARAEIKRISAALLDPSDEVVRAHSEALEQHDAAMFVRRNKSRDGDQWEVVRDLNSTGPISEETFVLHGIYATEDEAHAVAVSINRFERSRASLRAAGVKITGKD